MNQNEMHKILLSHLTKYRTWSYSQLAERVERDRQAHDCLKYVEGIAPDETQYHMEFQAVWDDKPHGDVRVLGALSVEPQKPLLGFLPVYTPDVTDSFIMSPDGRFVGEHETQWRDHVTSRHPPTGIPWCRGYLVGLNRILQSQFGSEPSVGEC